MSEFKSSNFRNEDGSAAPDIVGVTTFTSPYYFVPPSGTTAERPSGDGIVPGMLRFNTDIGRLEVWRGDHWATILGESPSLNGGARGLFGGGRSVSVIDYITISTLGNAIDFGDNTTVNIEGFSVSSSSRGLFAGTLSYDNRIDYVTISSTGNAQDFGDLSVARRSGGGCSNSTRGIFGGGIVLASPLYQSSNVIDYVTIASIGNAVDYGDLSNLGAEISSFSSSVRGVFMGGQVGLAPGWIQNNIIEYITISTTGNSQDFGDLLVNRGGASGCSNSTRGIVGGGGTPTLTNSIEFITIATTGNSQDFGDLTVARPYLAACSSSTRGIFGGGNVPPATNLIEYVTINSTGNAQDFGDLTVNKYVIHACSNAHGGL
jgi:hypothetical protein